MKTTRTITALLLLGVLLLPFLTGCSCSRTTTPDGSGANTSTSANGKADNAPIAFSDPTFETLLKAELGKDKITPADLKGFTGMKIMADRFLFLRGNGREEKSVVLFGEDTFEYAEQKYTGFGTMKTLADLKYFPDLYSLTVALQPEIDYGTIPILGQLTQFTVTQSKLGDIAFLSKAEKLLFLNLSTNDVTDISVLKNRTTLQFISLDWNRVSDISAIAGLTALEDISFYSNGISDISALANLKNLEEIGFYENKISDISVLKSLPKLKVVELINNKIEDVSPLKEFTAFERLALTGNPVKNIGVLKHIENLEFE